MLEKFLYLSDLFDTYGKLLTDKQQACLEMSLYQDFSLSEIACELGISRQAVYDTLHRCEKLMNEYEAQLKIIQQNEERKKIIKDIRDLIDLLDKTNKDELKGQIEVCLDKLVK